MINMIDVLWTMVLGALAVSGFLALCLVPMVLIKILWGV